MSQLLLTHRTLAESRGTHVTWRKSLTMIALLKESIPARLSTTGKKLHLVWMKPDLHIGELYLVHPFIISTLAKVTPHWRKSASFLY